MAKYEHWDLEPSRTPTTAVSYYSSGCPTPEYEPKSNKHSNLQLTSNYFKGAAGGSSRKLSSLSSNRTFEESVFSTATLRISTSQGGCSCVSDTLLPTP